MFYIREIKFDVINYAFIVKNRVNKSISRYMTSKKLNITIQMFKNWINKQHDIEINKKNTRKIKFICRDRKFIIENEFIEFFIEIKNRNRRINKRWFVYTIKNIYQRLYSKRINRDFENCKTFRIQISRKCEPQFDKAKIIIMIACRANTESKKVLFAFLCITTNSKSNDLQLKHVARFIRTIQQTKRLYNWKFARHLVLQLLV